MLNSITGLDSNMFATQKSGSRLWRIKINLLLEFSPKSGNSKFGPSDFEVVDVNIDQHLPFATAPVAYP